MKPWTGPAIAAAALLPVVVIGAIGIFVAVGEKNRIASSAQAVERDPLGSRVRIGGIELLKKDRNVPLLSIESAEVPICFLEIASECVFRWQPPNDRNPTGAFVLHRKIVSELRP